MNKQVKQITAVKWAAILLLVTAQSCSKQEIPPVVPEDEPDFRKISISPGNISYTEAWINIKLDSVTLPANITLNKNTKQEEFILHTEDTTVYVDSLIPDEDYLFWAELTGDTGISDTVTARTLKPASHNFTYETWKYSWGWG